MGYYSDLSTLESRLLKVAEAILLSGDASRTANGDSIRGGNGFGQSSFRGIMVRRSGRAFI